MKKTTRENANSMTGGWSILHFTIRCIASLAFVVMAALGAFAWQSKASFLKTVTDIPLPGAANRFDYQDLDPQTNRLYITHLAGDSVVVFDVKQQKVIADILDVPRAHGVLSVPARKRIYASATGKSEIAVINPITLKVEARIPAGKYPDGLAYDPIGEKLFVSDEHGGADVVIDAKTNRFVQSIPLGGDVGNTQYDSQSKQIWVAVGATNELVVIDPATEKIVTRYPLAGAVGPHGLYLDQPRHQAYIACQGNGKVLLFDIKSRKLIGSQTCGGDPDVFAFDPGLHRLYLACESGVVNGYDVGPGTLTPIGELHVKYAHTVAVDPRTHRVYLPLQDIGGRPVLRILMPEGMPAGAAP